MDIFQNFQLFELQKLNVCGVFQNKSVYQMNCEFQVKSVPFDNG